jgi:hypothetical protein
MAIPLACILLICTRRASAAASDVLDVNEPQRIHVDVGLLCRPYRLKASS